MDDTWTNEGPPSCHCGKPDHHAGPCRKSGPCVQCGRRTRNFDNGSVTGERVCATCEREMGKGND